MLNEENSNETASPSGEDLITIENCNSIEKATISLRSSSLNIKYGPNGLGKSTIAQALTLRAEGDEALEKLTPFKYRALLDGPRPRVTGADSIKSVLTFDDTYVAQFVFQQDEVLKNSFEIFINTEEYKQGLLEIEEMFESLKNTFVEQSEFRDALKDFTELRDAFSITKAGALAKTSKAFKALTVGGKLTNIPEALQGYEGFLHGDDPAGWITWQSKGKAYLELSENCPFCAVVDVDKVTAGQVSKEYESTAVRHMAALKGTIDKLGQYFEPGFLEQLEELTTTLTSLTAEQSSLLVSMRSNIETLLNKLTSLQSLSFHSLRDEDNVAEVLGNLKINLPLLHSLNSEATRAVVELINGKLDEVVTQIGGIKGRVGKQKTRVARIIKKNQDEINAFLSSAGYRYAVRIEEDGSSYRMLLEHQDAPGHLGSAANHLSYGEKNAFALVLFMHHVQSVRPDLVVLDDPVSSFDKTKKFAIIHQLFRGSDSLRGVTSLLLTHDIEPAIDIVRASTAGRFKAAKPVVNFLVGRAGTVTEIPVESQDITTFSQVCEENIASAAEPVVKCIYLRRLFEVHGHRGVAYELLSNLVHLRDVPIVKVGTPEEAVLDKSSIATATRHVQDYIFDFDYHKLLSEIKNLDYLKARFDATSVGYEKVQLFRIMLAQDPTLKGDDVFTKFVNESYHIENEYVMQLNPRKFDAVPEYVIAACTERIARVSGA